MCMWICVDQTRVKGQLYYEHSGLKQQKSIPSTFWRWEV